MRGKAPVTNRISPGMGDEADLGHDLTKILLDGDDCRMKGYIWRLRAFAFLSFGNEGLSVPGVKD